MTEINNLAALSFQYDIIGRSSTCHDGNANTHKNISDDGNNETLDNLPGRICIDVAFDDAPVKICCITFRNYFTATISVKAKNIKENPDQLYKTAMHECVLMKYPHCDTNGQDYFMLTFESLKSKLISNPISHMRLILKQPSYNWKTFEIHDLNVFSHIESKQQQQQQQQQAVTSVPILQHVGEFPSARIQESLKQMFDSIEFIVAESSNFAKKKQRPCPSEENNIENQ